MTYTANSAWDYERRQYDPLPAGYRANSERCSGVMCVLDVNAGVYIKCGLGLAQSGITEKGIRQFRLPTGSSTAADFGGILWFDPTLFRAKNVQPLRTHTKDDACTVFRAGSFRVHKFGAVAINNPVYWVISASGSEEPGMFKATQGSNSVLINNARWGENNSVSGVGVATLELLISGV
jgi:hypothetical protein